MEDFSRPRTKEPTFIEFKIDDDVFQAYPAVGGSIIDDVLDISEFGDLLSIDPTAATPQDAVALTRANAAYNLKLMNFLDQVLLPDSAARYAERLRSVTDPIEKPQSQQVVRFLIGEYSKPHPTEPLSPSTNGRGGMSASSTATA